VASASLSGSYGVGMGISAGEMRRLFFPGNLMAKIEITSSSIN
jgi:hypothetical protein